MDTKKFALGTLTGGVVFFVTGFLFYGLLLKDFMIAGYADGILKETPEWGMLILAELIFGAFLTMVLRRWPDAGTLAAGAKAGDSGPTVLTLLLGLGFSLVTYATTNTIEAAVIPVEAVVSAIRGALAGGAIGAVLGRS